MAISYLGLRETLRNNGIKKKALRENLGIGREALAKISKDENIAMDTLEQIARYINQVIEYNNQKNNTSNEPIDIGDLVSLK